MDMSRVTLGDKIVAGAGIALILNLLLLPWHQVFSFSLTAIDQPGGRWGWLAIVLTVAIIVLTAVRRLTPLSLPTLPRPIGEANLAATVLVLVVLVIKLVLDLDFLGFGVFSALALAVVMVTGAALGREETDEVPPVGTSGGSPPTPF